MPVFDHGVAQLPPVAVGVAVLGAPVLLVLGRRAPRLAVDLVAMAFCATTLALVSIVLATASSGRVVTWVAGWAPHHGDTVGVVLVADPVGAGIAVAAAALMAVALVYSSRYIESVRAHFHCLMLLFLGGMVGLALSGDVFDMFGFFELMGAATYGLTGMMVEEPSSLQGAVNFGIVNSLGAYVTLMGIGLLLARTGRLDLPGLGHALAHHRPDALVICAFCLVLTGFLVKGAVAPFHFWLADAHAVAPSPVCILFSGAMLPLGVYAAFRIYWTVFSGTIPPGDVRRAFLVLGAATAVIGAVMALTQRHVKRLLSYSTIAHVGLFVVAAGCLTADGTAGAALYVAGYAGAIGALFLVAGVLLDLYGTVDEHELFGRARPNRALGALFAAGAVAIAALPPFGTGLGSAVSTAAARALGYAWAPALFVGVPALTGAAALRAWARTFLGVGARPTAERGIGAEAHRATGGGEQPEAEIRRAPWSMLVPVVLLLAAALSVGLLPGILGGMERAGAYYVDRVGYVHAALFHAHARVTVHAVGGWNAYGVGTGVLSALGAAGIAGLALFGRPLLERFPAVRRLSAPVGLLHRLHSGHVGDYVAWLVAGVAVLAGFVGIPLR
ncbi:MAG TPA: complex I subunit 5 family protein [Acidimicrobiales bacterium]|nr:complex I subunit 5 family protein [Acidimicrobiales bacterium]